MKEILFKLTIAEATDLHYRLDDPITYLAWPSLTRSMPRLRRLIESTMTETNHRNQKRIMTVIACPHCDIYPEHYENRPIKN